MYIHLGNDFIIDKNSIIGVFDLEDTTVNGTTRDFIRSVENVVYISGEMPKSFIVAYNEKKDTVVYVSPISAETLRKRAENNYSY